MVNYWIETPVENALEVVQRYLDDPNHAFSQYAGKVLTYEPPTEVIFYANDFNLWVDDYSKIYYGRLYLLNDDSFIELQVNDGSNWLQTISFTGSPAKAGTYDGIIFNSVVGFPSGNVVFAGYGFNVDYQVQSQNRIRLLDLANTRYILDIGTFNNSQDDQNVTIEEPDGTLTTFSILQTPNYTPVHIECYKDPASVGGWMEIRCDADINYADLTYVGGYDYFDIELIACNKLTYLNMFTNYGIPDASVDKVISQLVDYNQSNGTLITPSNNYFTNLFTRPAVKADYDTLISRGWTIS